MKKFLTSAAIALLFVANATAQNIESEETTSNNYVVIDMPVNADPGEAVLMQDYNNRTYLRENINSTSITRNTQASEYVIQERLKRIPTTMDLVYNDITKGYINKYANQMKRSVGVMLAAMNFYRPIFEEALERYGLPYELQYLPVIESSLKPSATSPVGAVMLDEHFVVREAVALGQGTATGRKHQTGILAQAFHVSHLLEGQAFRPIQQVDDAAI